MLKAPLIAPASPPEIGASKNCMPNFNASLLINFTIFGDTVE